jgi:hypothetical protein
MSRYTATASGPLAAGDLVRLAPSVSPKGCLKSTSDVGVVYRDDRSVLLFLFLLFIFSFFFFNNNNLL